MGKQYPKLKLNFTRGLQIVAVTFSLAFSALPPETSFHSFFWTKDAGETVQRGCYGHTKIGDYSPKDGGYLSTFWLTDYEWWQKLFVNTYITITVRTEQGQPSRVSRASGHFENVEWLTGFSRNGSDDAISFYFPLHPQTKPFGRYDYFTVDVNDTLDLEFYGAGDSIMVGTFVHKKPDERGAVNILGRNAIIVELTDANPMRINTIRCNGEYKELINAYLNYDLDKFAKDKEWYGISVIDTVQVLPKVVVHSVHVENGDQLVANSSTNISWETNLPEEVESCRILVSFDNKKTWQVIGNTDGESAFTWKIPNVQSDSTFIKISADSKSGETTSDISAALKIASNDIIHSVVVGVEGTTQLEAEEKIKISWQMDSPESMDSCVISVSYDNKKTWQKIVKTQPRTEHYWVVSNVKEDSVYIKVTAYDKSGNAHSAISDMMTIMTDIVLTSLTIADNKLIMADSIYEISWRCNIPSEVDSCVLESSFDNKKTWTRIGKTKEDNFLWRIPNVPADSSFIRVTAVCSDGMQVSEVTPMFTIVPIVEFESVSVAETEELKADSGYTITWNINFPEIIDSFTLSVSYDNKRQWEALGNTVETVFDWVVPNSISDSTFIKVTAYDKNSNVTEIVTRKFIIIPDIVVDSLVVEGPDTLIADSSYNVKWKYNFPSKVDSSVLMVSVNNKKTWDTLVVFDTQSNFQWKVPNMKADSAYLKVTSYGKNKQVKETVSEVAYSIDPGASTGVLGRDRSLEPGFATVSTGQKLRINYTLPKGATRITLSIIDLKGRSITKTLHLNELTAQAGSFQIDQGIHSGYYYLRFRAEYAAGKRPIVLTRKWLKMN